MIVMFGVDVTWVFPVFFLVGPFTLFVLFGGLRYQKEHWFILLIPLIGFVGLIDFFMNGRPVSKEKQRKFREMYSFMLENNLGVGQLDKMIKQSNCISQYIYMCAKSIIEKYKKDRYSDLLLQSLRSNKDISILRAEHFLSNH